MSGRSTTQMVRELESRIPSWRPRRKTTDRKHFAAMARAFLHRASEDFLLEDEGSRWLGESEKMLALASRRAKGKSHVRVEAPTGRGEAKTSVVRTCMRDHAFIVDSLQLALDQLGIEVLDRMNMVQPVRRDDAGRLKQLGVMGDDTIPESFVWLEIAPVDSVAERKSIEQELRTRMEEVRTAVRDVAFQTASVKAARETARLADEQLKAEQARHAIGLSTTFEVTEFQQTLAQARSDLVADRAGYAKSLAGLAYAEGRLEVRPVDVRSAVTESPGEPEE